MKILCFITFLIYGMILDARENSRILLGEWKELKPSGVASKTIREKLRDSLNTKDLSVTLSELTSLDARIQEASKGGYSLLLEGDFSRDTTTKNLNLYVQVFHPEKGIIIDAYSLNDDSITSISLPLDFTEFKETDPDRLERFSSKISSAIRINPNRKVSSIDISEYLLNFPFLKEKWKYAQNKEESIVRQSEEVFDFFASQTTVSSTKIERKVSEAPNMVSVINQNEIRAFGRFSLNDILYQLPGFSPSQDYDRRTVSARGLYQGWNNNHLLMLIDGIQINDNVYGTAYTSEITPTNFIKSVEVLRGAGSSLYGSNAMYGVISLNTYSGKDLKGDIDLRFRMGTSGRRIVDFLTGDTGKIFSHVVSYSSFQTNGTEYREVDGSGRLDAFGYLEKFSTRDNRKNQSIFLKLEGEGVLKGLSLQYFNQRWNFQTGFGWLWHVPDFRETMGESRDIFTIKYENKVTEQFSHQYLTRIQLREIDWNIRFYPNGAFLNTYPAGVSETIKTGVNDILSRAQWTYLPKIGGSLLGGVEVSQLRYGGDREHFSNAQVDNPSGGYPATAGNIFKPLGPTFEWIKDRPARKFAAFGQVGTGKIIKELVEFTLGVRFDESQFPFRGIDQKYSDTIGKPSLDIPDIYTGSRSTVIPSSSLGAPFVTEEKRIFRRTSPRIGIVFFPIKNLTIKLLAAQAFREPTISELFGANTFALNSNPRKLRPEVMKTYEAGFDWFPNNIINLRGNYFHTRLENEIAYSTANKNLSTNVYTLTTHGIESEILINYKNINFFGNISYSKRIGEQIQDETISREEKRTTWVPYSRGNLGIIVKENKFQWSFTLERQGIVERRRSDLGKVEPITGNLTYSEDSLAVQFSNPYRYPMYRPEILPAWINCNTRISYKVQEQVEIGIFLTNIFNSGQKLIKNNAYPFDYQREGRGIMIDFSARF